MPETLDQLVMTRRVLVTVGAGGRRQDDDGRRARRRRGAARGKRVLCLTIDPGAPPRRGARPGADVGATSRRSTPALFAAVGPAHEGLAHGDDARHEAHVRRARRQVLVVARARAQKLLEQQALPVRLDVARRARRSTWRWRSSSPCSATRASTSSSSTRRPRRTRSTSSTRPSALIEALDSPTMRWFVAGVRVDGQALAQPPRAVGGRRAARPRAASRAAASSRRWPSSSPS